MLPSTCGFVDHTHKICKTHGLHIAHHCATRTQNTPKNNLQFLVHSSHAESFCLRNETGQSSQPLSQKWIIYLLPKLGPISPFLHFLALFICHFLFFLKIIDMVIHLRCSGNLNLAPALLVICCLLAWDSAACACCNGSNSHCHAYPQ